MIYNRIAVMRAERRLSRKDLAAAIGVNIPFLFAPTNRV